MSRCIVCTRIFCHHSLADIHSSFDADMILIGEKKAKIFLLFTIVAALSWFVIQQLSTRLRGLKNRKVHITYYSLTSSPSVQNK